MIKGFHLGSGYGFPFWNDYFGPSPMCCRFLLELCGTKKVCILTMMGVWLQGEARKAEAIRSSPFCLARYTESFGNKSPGPGNKIIQSLCGRKWYSPLNRNPKSGTECATLLLMGSPKKGFLFPVPSRASWLHVRTGSPENKVPILRTIIYIGVILGIMEKKMETTGIIWGLYWGYIGDNGKENGNYY